MKIEDYLSDDEMKDIAKEEFIKLLSDNKEKERLLTNMAYNLGYGFIKELIDDEDLAVLKTKVKELMNNKTHLKMAVYDKPDAWNMKPKDDLVVYNEIQKAIKENIHLVRENTIKELENLDLDNFQDEFDLNRIFELLLTNIQGK